MSTTNKAVQNRAVGEIYIYTFLSMHACLGSGKPEIQKFHFNVVLKIL